ncbi:MAG: rsmD [Rickettsiaceae bacterium]|jgi:16S rRNA (guanine966-N2)-methyltransferase|nr:rsmD [Rickettsiaceae bacterium]
MMKIIAGRLKGRNIPTFKGNRYRPSQSRLREALFSILSSGEFAEQNILQDAIVLDLFSGAGSLSFEALSRGAAHCTMVDVDAEHLKLAQSAAEHFGEIDNVNCLRLDAANLPMATKKFNLIFIDPPYHSKLADKAMKSIMNKGWLKDGAIVAVEVSRKEDIKPVKSFSVVLERIYGNSKLIILNYQHESEL